MPKIVDHAQRREDMARAAWAVIARRGLTHATMRSLALEFGVSVGALVYYFTDKKELLSHALRAAHLEVRRLYDESDPQGSLTGLAALREFMLLCLPLDEHRRTLAAVELAFWAEAIGDEELSKINEEESRNFDTGLRHFLAQAIEAGETRANLNITSVVEECRTLMDGLSMQSVMNPLVPPPERQIKMLDSIIDRIRK